MKYHNVWIAILLALLLFTVGVRTQELEALNECVKEVETNCSGLYKYAVSLEDENARLNRLYGECRDNASR